MIGCIGCIEIYVIILLLLSSSIQCFGNIQLYPVLFFYATTFIGSIFARLHFAFLFAQISKFTKLCLACPRSSYLDEYAKHICFIHFQ